MLHRLLNALAAAVLFLATGLTIGASAEEAHFRVGHPTNRPDILVMVWQGKIAAPMSEDIKAAFDNNKDSIRSVELKLNSGGGSVAEGERVIAVLQSIKTTHTLVTSVAAGKQCGSMCVFIYVQGQKRLAAAASLWLFHEVSNKDRKTQKTVSLDRARWEQLVDKYWVPAGVDQKWIETVKTHTVGTDYWQSGDSLLRDGANIIQKALSDEHKRTVVSLAAPAPTRTCRKFSAETANMVEMACQ